MQDMFYLYSAGLPRIPYVLFITWLPIRLQCVRQELNGKTVLSQ